MNVENQPSIGASRKRSTKLKWAEPVSLHAKTAIVTGCANGSLGYETAKTLALWGATVIVTTRENTQALVSDLRDDCQRAGIPTTIFGKELDLSNADSVAQFCTFFHGCHGGRLDILVNNAGIHLDLMSKWKEPRLSADGYEIQWRTNYLGTAQLTHNLLPLLKKTGEQMGDARIVNVVSQLHNRADNEALFDPNTGYNSWKFYGRSKLALMHFSNELNRRFAKEHNVRSYSLHPGGTSGVATNVASKGLENSPIMSFVNKLSAPLGKLFMSNAEEGAQTQIHCATAANATGGLYYRNCQAADASEAINDLAAGHKLWNETLEFVKSLERGV